MKLRSSASHYVTRMDRAKKKHGINNAATPIAAIGPAATQATHASNNTIPITNERTAR